MIPDTHIALFLHEPVMLCGALLFGLLAMVLTSLLTLFSLGTHGGSDA